MGNENQYPNTGTFGWKFDTNAEWYQQCLKVKDTKPPSTDIPTEPLVSSLKNRDPTSLYYNTYFDAKHNPQFNSSDWHKVRACAFVKNDGQVLMMLYANGFGINQNLNLAVKYACEDETPLEIPGRVEHLTKVKEHSPNERDIGDFDVCDDATAGPSLGRCSAIEEQQNEMARNLRLAGISSKWKSAQITALGMLKVSLDSFAFAHANLENDAGGSFRAASVNSAITAGRDSFLEDIEQFEQGSLPKFTKADFDALDKELNQIYQQLMHTTADGNNSQFVGNTGISKNDIKKTQKSWLKYRDAWVVLGRIRYQSVPPHSWEAHLTQRRIKQLKELQEYADTLGR